MHWIKLIAIAALMTGCALLEDEVEIPLSDVPPAAMAAADTAVPGIEIEAAELETEAGQKVYELSGTADGKVYEIEVSGTGEILEVEEE